LTIKDNLLLLKREDKSQQKWDKEQPPLSSIKFDYEKREGNV
jgi:hypothetical protein